MKLQLLTFGLITLALVCLVQALPQQGQLIQDTRIDDKITNPSGSRREEITDDRILAEPGGVIEEIKTDQISNTFGSGSNYNPNLQGNYNPNYSPSGRR